MPMRHGRWHTDEQAEDHDDLARDPGLFWSGAVAGILILVIAGFVVARLVMGPG